MLLGRPRAKPGQLNFGCSGQGSTNQFATELLMHAAGLRMTHVPYKGMGPATTDVIAGHIGHRRGWHRGGWHRGG